MHIGRAGPVTRTGRTRGAATITAVTATAAVLLAGCGTRTARRHTVRRTINSAAVIARLAGLANGLHAAPYQPPSCPAILASYRITFVPAARSAPQVVVTPSGCLTVGVTVAGAAQPLLWGDTALIQAAMQLLHLKRLVP